MTENVSGSSTAAQCGRVPNDGRVPNMELTGLILLVLSGSSRQIFVGSVNVMVVGTNSPLILLMPEVGLLYILSSSDPLCGGEGQVRSGQAL